MSSAFSLWRRGPNDWFSYMNCLISNCKAPIKSSCIPLWLLFSWHSGIVRLLSRKKPKTKPTPQINPQPTALLIYQTIGFVLCFSPHLSCWKSFRVDYSMSSTSAMIFRQISRQWQQELISGKTVKTTDRWAFEGLRRNKAQISFSVYTPIT